MRRIFIFLALALASAAPLAAQGGAPEIVKKDGQFLGARFWGSEEYQIEHFLRCVANVQNYKFILPSATATNVLNLKVKIIAPAKISDGEGGLFIPKEAFFSVLQGMLKSQQQPMIMSPFGEDSATSVRLYEIIPLAAATKAGRADDVQILSNVDEFVDNGAGFVTLIAPLKYASAATVRGALANFATQNSVMPVDAAGSNVINALIICDYVDNVRRIAKIIKLLDQPPRAPRLEVIPVNYMDAEELVTAIDELISNRNAVLQQGGAGAGAVRPPSEDDRVEISLAPNVNALMVQGYDAGIMLVKNLVNTLDKKIPGSEVTMGKIHIYQARNVPSDKLYETLNSVLSGGVPLSQIPGAPGVPPPAVPSTNQNDNAPTIIEDRNTKSLIITARPADYSEILRILQKIDVRPPQVQIEGAILEVQGTDSFQFGSELATIGGAGDSLRANAAMSFGLSTLVAEDGTPIDVGGGVPAGRMPILGTGGVFALTNGGPFDIPLLVKFFKSQQDTNVLSAPYIVSDVTEENPISINVESEVAFSGSTVTTGIVSTAQAGTATAGITLTIIPRLVSPDDHITLVITFQSSAFTGSSQPGLQPNRSTRSLETTLTIPNRNTVILGGMKGTQKSRSVSKIPFLGDIPILGELFKNTTTDAAHTNLYILIRPEIFHGRNFEDMVNLSQEKLAEAESKLESSPESRDFFKKARQRNEAQKPQIPGRISRNIGLHELPEDE